MESDVGQSEVIRTVFVPQSGNRVGRPAFKESSLTIRSSRQRLVYELGLEGVANQLGRSFQARFFQNARAIGTYRFYA